MAALILTVGWASGGAPAPGSADWPDWRGPARDGVSDATGLPESWSPEGGNLAWVAPFGGRSAPVVLHDRLYLQNTVGEGAQLQERIVALDADTGAVIWEHRFNVTLSDAPPHRVGWSSPAVDPQSGNVYALGVDGTFLGLSPTGELLWEHFLSESFGMISTHGGRTPSPVVEGGQVIVSGVTGGWGALARGMHRFIAADKRTGEIAWVSTPGDRPYDTTYAPPVVRDIGGRRLLITGGGDGAVQAVPGGTGIPAWHFPLSKRGINTGVAVAGETVIVSHGEENVGDSTMGVVAAIDGSGSGELGAASVRWSRPGLLNGYSSPVLVGDRYYQIDNGANLMALDAASGALLWSHNLGTIQRASPVYADGKLYVGTVNGTFYILRPGDTGVEVLDRDQLGSEEEIEEIIASVAVARGRIYLVSRSHVYAIGPAAARIEPRAMLPDEAAVSRSPIATLIVHPQELVLRPGDRVQYEARLYDARGGWIDTVGGAADWSVDGVEGNMALDGSLEVTGSGPAAGSVTARLEGAEGSARVRVLPPLPWSYDFDGLSRVPPFWVGATGKFVPAALDGNGVLVKTNDNPFLKRTKVFLGGSDEHDYTVQLDFKTDLDRRHMGDAGVIAQRYSLIAFGAKQRIELQSWQPETERTISVPFAVLPDVWYRLKLRTENLPAGGVRVQGKIWQADAAEPAEWTIERTDPVGIRRGSPGFYADAHAVVTFDNLIVEPNQ